MKILGRISGLQAEIWTAPPELSKLSGNHDVPFTTTNTVITTTTPIATNTAKTTTSRSLQLYK
jgi:hypothetical protein